MHFVPVTPQLLIRDHLAKCKNALLFVGMGIGKSAAVLDHLNTLFLDGSARAALIIAPLRVCALTWPAEVRDWTQFNWMKVANLRTEAGQRAFLNGWAHIYLINYESIPTLVSLVERRKGNLPYDVAVYDESTKAKNPGSKRINLFRRKVPRVERNIALTGTPTPNSHRDLFAQVRLVDGGERLGTSNQAFLQEYFHVTNYGGYPQFEEKAGTGTKLEQKISDITLTLKSSDWLNLPDTVYEDVNIEFSKELKDKYKTLEKELVIELRQDKTMNVPSAAALVTKLLQFTSGHMYDEAKEVHAIHNLKFDALKRIRKAEKQPILCAVIFQHEQEQIRKQFPEARFFADAKNEKQQQQMLADWNAKRIPLLVAHPASCGHGLNMQHGSSVLVWMSLTYSREMYEQMIARLARRGQKEVIKIYRLMVSGTVDDAVASAIETKQKNEQRLVAALQALESYRDTK